MKKINFFRHLLMLAAIVFAPSCSSPKEDFTTNPTHNAKDLKINYEITGVKVEALTRTPGSAKENLVNTIHTLFFDPTTKVFVGLIASGVANDSGTGTGSAIVTMPVGTNVEDHYELLFLANYNSYAMLGSESTTDTYLFNLLNGKTITEAQN